MKLNAEWPTIQPAAVPEKPGPPLSKDEQEAKTTEAWSNFNDTVQAHKKYVQDQEDKASASAAIQNEADKIHYTEVNDKNRAMMQDLARKDK